MCKGRYGNILSDGESILTKWRCYCQLLLNVENDRENYKRYNLQKVVCSNRPTQWKKCANSLRKAEMDLGMMTCP